MPYIPPEIVSKAREMDLLTYLRNYEPDELVHFGGSTYCTREHDSLKISNGKWCWFSRGIGGTSALDYLIKVKEIPFLDAVERITGQAAIQPPVFVSQRKQERPKVLLLPKASKTADRAEAYLVGRGIDRELIAFCIQTGRLYESEPYHNAVFVGLDGDGKARYANLRGIGTDFIGDANGSDKRYSFGIPSDGRSDTLHLFESAIDLLSFGTLLKMEGIDWRRDNMLSLAGVYKPRKDAMVTELTDFNRNMMLSIDVLPVPTDEAVREVENRLLGVETNITNWQRRQNANNNFSAVVPYDMECLPHSHHTECGVSAGFCAGQHHAQQLGIYRHAQSGVKRP